MEPAKHRIHRAAGPLGALCVMMLALPGLAAAQTAAPPGDAREIPRPEQLEPGVATTPAAAVPSQASPAPAAAAAPPAASPASVDAGPAPAAKPAGKETTAAGKETTAKAAAHKGPDRLELDATDITGNRELPKVLYIVPWKRSDLGDVVGRPVNSLLDEVLEPLDRDVFQRQNRYYDGLKGAGGDAKAGAAQGSPGKP